METVRAFIVLAGADSMGAPALRVVKGGRWALRPEMTRARLAPGCLRRSLTPRG